MQFKIGDKDVGVGRCFIIAEVGQAHDGSLAMAHWYIDQAAIAGVDAVKFQAHVAEFESSPADKFRLEDPLRQDATRYGYWRRMEFSLEHWSKLRDHAREKGLAFIVSPFSMESQAMIAKVGVDAWKVASGEIVSIDMIGAMALTGKPALVSTGMATVQEIAAAVRKVGNAPVALFQCVSMYPSPASMAHLGQIRELTIMFKVPVGLSDHSGIMAAGLGAVAMGGCELLEVHVIADRSFPGPDSTSSLDLRQIKELVAGVRWLEEEKKALHLHKNDLATGPLKDTRRLFMKSIYAARDLGPGDEIRFADLMFLKPGTGIPPVDANTIVGRIAGKAIKKGDQINPRELLYR